MNLWSSPSRNKIEMVLRIYGYLWPNMEKDYKAYATGCEECQRHDPLQHIPLVPLNLIVKPSFVLKDVEEFAKNFKIRMIQSSPFYL